MILPCPCSPELARRRIAQRRQQGGDPSEADAAVLEAQLAALEPLEADERPFSLNLETAAASLASPDSGAVDADRDESAPQVLLESLLRQLRALV